MKEELTNVKKEAKELKKKVNTTEESYAKELLHYYVATNVRLFWIWFVTFAAFILLLFYTLYLLNDIKVVESTQQEITDVSTIGGNVINKGDINGEN